MKAHWRGVLPPLEQLDSQSLLRLAWLSASGEVKVYGQLPLSEVSASIGRHPLSLYLHPLDCRLTSLALPALPAARLATAVELAIQPLQLGDPGSVSTAWGARSADGEVPVAWLDTSQLGRIRRVLGECRLTARDVLPTPFLLPVGDAPGACLWDGCLLLRLDRQRALVYPVVEAAPADDGWLHFGGPDDSRCWTGEVPGWGLRLAAAGGAGADGLGRAAAIWAAALLVWIGGLHWYAGELSHEGQRLETQLRQRVQAAFPELPVVLNPLQQARERLTARSSGNAESFSGLLRAAGEGGAFLEGRLERLQYADGALQLQLLPGRNAADLASWQSGLAGLGIQAEARDQGWHLARATVVAATEDNHE